MRRDPRVRKDNLCVQCMKPRRTVTREMRQYAGDQIERDPFCSSTCCRAWHGTSLAPPAKAPPRMARHGTTGSAYKNGCRCEECVGAQREISRRRRERARQNGVAPDHKPSVGNYKLGCMCDGCRAAARQWRREKVAA